MARHNRFATERRKCGVSRRRYRDDCYIPNEADKYVTVKPYESYAETRTRLDFHARVIQRNYRAYRLMKYIRECARIYRSELEKCKRQEEKKAIAHKMRHKRNILRQIHPRLRADFDMLYSLIERWRSDRLKDAKSRMFKGAQRAESCGILEKTIEMFNRLDKHRQAVQSSYWKRRSYRFLTLNCKPVRWTGYKGKRVEMITLKIQKARKLKELYDALSNRDVSAKERMNLLTTLKQLAETHNCMEAFDLLFLLDREIALLAREINGLPLDYLNERTMHAYLNFARIHGTCGCETVGGCCEDNALREPLETGAKFCRSCLKLLPRHRFLPHSKTRKLSLCIGCSSLGQRSIAHVDYDPYVFILNCVRADEKRRQSASALAFMMQQHDVYHLVNHIWHGRSAISKTEDLFRLRLARYRRDAEWTPWNCILLTADEADVHRRIDDPATVYSRHLISQIDLAHQIAKNYFKRLITFEKDFRESSRFRTSQSVQLSGSGTAATDFGLSQNHES